MVAVGLSHDPEREICYRSQGSKGISENSDWGRLRERPRVTPGAIFSCFRAEVMRGLKHRIKIIALIDAP